MPTPGTKSAKPGQTPAQGQSKIKKKPSDGDSSKDAEPDSFESLRDEGDHFVHVAQWKRAIDSYTRALELLPDEPDKHCLVCRARCYLKLGNGEKALEDAEAALELDKEFPKGLHLKAEALYGMGDFETALVFFHRGHRLRPEMEEFRLGVQKAKEAIENSVGDPDTIKLENKGDLSHFQKMEEEEERKKRGKRAGKSTYSKPIRAREDNTKRRRERKTKPQNDKTVKQLLGELYADKEYLEKLLNDQDLCHQDTRTSYQVHELVLDCLEYLDTRTEFWQQQKPLYARERERQMRGKISKAGDINKWIIRQLEGIDDDQNNGRYHTSLKKAQKLERTMAGYKDREILNRASIMANIASLMGNAYLELGEYDKAEDFHNRDRQIAVDNDLEDAVSRALDNLGRVFARRGEFEKAVDVWEEKLPLAKTALEKTWLYHEIGRCHQELADYEKARNYGERSLAEAQEAEDDVWQLNGCVLIAQAEVKMGDLSAAQDSFERALDMAKAQGDTAAEAAIKRAIEDVKKKMVQGAQGDNKDHWTVTVVTSDKAGAGTDSKIFILLYGNQKNSRKLELLPPDGMMEKGSTNTFELSTPRLGIVQRIRLGHDGSGKYPGWHCEKVTLVNKKKGHTYEYNVDQWFDSTSGDNEIERDCFAEGPLPEDSVLEEGKERWNISVFTSDRASAGTDSNVFLVIMGTKGNTPKLELDKQGNDFERGNCDEFEKVTNSVGAVQRIRLGHDNSTRYAGWHVDKVEIAQETTGKKFVFPCNRWLSDDEGDKKTEVELWADGVTKQGDDSESLKQKWKLKIYTSDKLGAGTDANVYIILEGDRGTSRKITLDNHGNDFEKGKCDTFEVQSEEIGEVMKIRIGHDNAGRSSGWHLNKVEVTGVEPSFGCVVFTCDQWLDDSDGDKKTERELFPDDDKKAAGADKKPKGQNGGNKPTAGKSSKDDGDKSSPKSNGDEKVDWHIELHTSEESGSGTDANVHLVLIGSKGESEKLSLPKDGKYFESGAKDTFDLSTRQIGTLQRVRVGHDNSGLGSGWQLSKVVVVSRATDQSLVFPCGRWLADDEDDKRTELELTTEGVVPDSSA